MPRGTLEVLLVSAKGLENMDFLCNMDPYCILTCRTQDQKSSVASGQETKPKWNETFVFSITEGVSELKIKIMDSDFGTRDDFVGETTISLDPVFEEGSVPAKAYNVVKHEKFEGAIKVGLTFRPEEGSYDDRESYGQEERSYGDRESYAREERNYGDRESYEQEERSYGGWKESGYAD